MGFEESSFILDPQKHEYSFVQHVKQRYISYKKNDSHKAMNKIEVVNGVRVLHLGNKTYVLGKSTAQNMTELHPGKPDGYSIMQAPFFIHKAYFEMFSDPLMVPLSAVELVEKWMNCEDILLSIMVTKFLKDLKEPQCGVLTIKSSLSIKDLENEAGEYNGLLYCFIVRIICSL